MSYPEKSKSYVWFLLPILLGVIGGIIAFFVLRHDDPRKARNCLYLGIAFMFVGIMLNDYILYTVPEAVQDIDTGFDVNI